MEYCSLYIELNMQSMKIFIEYVFIKHFFCEYFFSHDLYVFNTPKFFCTVFRPVSLKYIKKVFKVSIYYIFI